MDTMDAEVNELINHDIPTPGKVFERMIERECPSCFSHTNCLRKSDISDNCSQSPR
jgi:hypothetical protein